MKHFSKLAALLLGAALIFGFAGCANSTDSTDSDSSENVVYTLKNGLTDSDSNPISMTISYKNKSGVYVNEQTIPVNETYEIPASDAKIGSEPIDHIDYIIDSPAIYLKIKVNGTEVEGFIEADFEKVVIIYGVETTESGLFWHWSSDGTNRKLATLNKQ